MIDGETLPLLSEEHLLDTLGLKLGPALKIRSQVENHTHSDWNVHLRRNPLKYGTFVPLDTIKLYQHPSAFPTVSSVPRPVELFNAGDAASQSDT